MFISEFTIGGTTVTEALEHQKGWKELCDANLLISEFWEEGYVGYYKGLCFGIGEYGDYLSFTHKLPKLPSERLDITFGSFKDKEEIFKILHLDGEPIKKEFLDNCFCNSKGLEVVIKEKGKYISFIFDSVKLSMRRIGILFEPMENEMDLLKKRAINGKSFKEIYDTEYDDGEMLKGYYT